VRFLEENRLAAATAGLGGRTSVGFARRQFGVGGRRGWCRICGWWRRASAVPPPPRNTQTASIPPLTLARSISVLPSCTAFQVRDRVTPYAASGSTPREHPRTTLHRHRTARATCFQHTHG
jgi:hypothetical protein